MVTATAPSTQFFEKPIEPPLVGSASFSLVLWERVRSRGIMPDSIGALDDTPELRMEFLDGAAMMGFALVDLDDEEAIEALRNNDPSYEPLQPQQLLIADALNANMPRAVAEIPRRASKTTTIFCWCLGRLKNRPRYKITFSAQTGANGLMALDEWARDGLERITPPGDEDIPPWLRGVNRKSAQQSRNEALFGLDAIPNADRGSQKREFRVRRAAGKPGIEFTNGSYFFVVRPEASAYRGKAADVSWVDEAQEIAPEDSDALLAGILPLQDTRPDSMIVLSGTAGEVRSGAFWSFVEQLRSGDPKMGGVDFAIPDDTPWSAIENEAEAMALLTSTHPGIGTLTTAEKMRERYHDLPRPEWAREYLSLWPETFGTRAVPAEWWSNTAIAKFPKMPKRVSFGYAVKPGGSVAAIVAAWRDGKGRAYLEVVEHRPGTLWMPKRLQELSRSFPGCTIAYDDIAEGKATATEANRLRPRPKLRMQTYRETAAGCIQFLRDLERGTLRHVTGNAGLDSAVEHAAKRETRDGVWLFTPMERGDDITCLDAGVRALRNWDQHYAGKNTASEMVTS